MDKQQIRNDSLDKLEELEEQHGPNLKLIQAKAEVKALATRKQEHGFEAWCKGLVWAVENVLNGNGKE